MKTFFLVILLFLFSRSEDLVFDERIISVNDYTIMGVDSGYYPHPNFEPFVSNGAIYYVKTISSEDCVEEDEDCNELFGIDLSVLDKEQKIKKEEIPKFTELCRFFPTIGNSTVSRVPVTIRFKGDDDCQLYLLHFEEEIRAERILQDYTINNSYQLLWSESIFFSVSHGNEEELSLLQLKNDGSVSTYDEFTFSSIIFPIISPNFVVSNFFVNDPFKYRIDTNDDQFLFIGQDLSFDRNGELYQVNSTLHMNRVESLPKSKNDYQQNQVNMSTNYIFPSIDGASDYFPCWNPKTQQFGKLDIQGGTSLDNHQSTLFLNSTSFVTIIERNQVDVLMVCTENSNDCQTVNGMDGFILNPRSSQSVHYPPTPVSGLEDEVITVDRVSLVGMDVLSYGVDNKMFLRAGATGEHLYLTAMYDYNGIYVSCSNDTGTIICEPFVSRPGFLEVSMLKSDPEDFGSIRFMVNLEDTILGGQGWLALVVQSAQTNRVSLIIRFDWNEDGKCIPSCSSIGSIGCNPSTRKCDCKEHFADPHPIEFQTCGSCEHEWYTEHCNVFCSESSATGTCSGHGNCDPQGQCKCINEYFNKNCSSCITGRDMDEECQACLKGYLPIPNEKICGKEMFCFGLPRSDVAVCGSHGECEETNKCVCEEEYDFNDDCTRYQCFSIFNDNEKEVCSGNGRCTSPNKCSCLDGFYGDSCEDGEATGSFFWLLTIILVACLVPFYILIALVTSYLSYLKKKRQNQRIIDQMAGFGDGFGGIIVPPIDEEEERDERIRGEGEDVDMEMTGHHFVEMITDDDDEERFREGQGEGQGRTGVREDGKEEEEGEDGEARDAILNLSPRDEGKFTFVDIEQNEGKQVKRGSYDDNDYNY